MGYESWWVSSWGLSRGVSSLSFKPYFWIYRMNRAIESIVVGLRIHPYRVISARLHRGLNQLLWTRLILSRKNLPLRNLMLLLLPGAYPFNFQKIVVNFFNSFFHFFPNVPQSLLIVHFCDHVTLLSQFRIIQEVHFINHLIKQHNCLL